MIVMLHFIGCNSVDNTTIHPNKIAFIIVLLACYNSVTKL